MNQTQTFQKFGAVVIPQLIPKDFCYFLTHVLMHQAARGEGPKGDSQIPNAASIMDHEVMFETILERVWPILENTAGEPLLPTYAYSRLYTNGDILTPHTDRESCEISCTVQLGRSHHYSWPIYMGGKPYYLAEGDAVLYRGCDVEHWREPCNGPEGYYSGQVFFHYVREKGPYASFAGDKRWNQLPFNRFRTYQMESK